MLTESNISTVHWNGPRPTIVCLSGSSRFAKDFADAAKDETLKGFIVLSIGCDLHNDPDFADPEILLAIKPQLDELHKRKIDLADELLIINPNDYIGQSTRDEISYARHLEKPVRFLWPTSHAL